MSVVVSVDVEPAALAARADEFEAASASAVIAWAIGRFGARLTLASSFQNCVVIDLAVREDPAIEVLFLDTGCHFPETWSFVEEVRSLYNLNLRVERPGPDAGSWPCGSPRCCELRKVEPLNRALRGRAAWMTGLRRCDTPMRSAAPIVSWDKTRALVKVNPLANWSDDDVNDYIVDHALPVHPLVAKGYLSIGCARRQVPSPPGPSGVRDGGPEPRRRSVGCTSGSGGSGRLAASPCGATCAVLARDSALTHLTAR
jgi:phosphoadenosine phosphosulfate reductase